jgi:hypothetical protein
MRERLKDKRENYDNVNRKVKRMTLIVWNIGEKTKNKHSASMCALHSEGLWLEFNQKTVCPEGKGPRWPSVCPTSEHVREL